MDSTTRKDAIVQWLQTEFESEQKAGFPLIRRVPDTQVIRFVDHFASLDDAGQSALKAIMFDWSSFSFLGDPLPNPVWKGFTQATAFPALRGGLRYTGVKLLAGLAKDVTYPGLDGYFQSMGIAGLALEPPQALVGDAVDLTPIGIPSLRRKINAAFSELFATEVADLGSEMWRYEGILDGCRISVDIRYSGKLGNPQLTYTARVLENGRLIVRPSFCFESAFGVGLGHWDYVTIENADRSVKLLSDLVHWVARLPERLPPACCSA